MKTLIDWIVALFKPTPKAQPAKTARGDALAWGKKVSPTFRVKAIDVAKSLGIQPDHLMAIMAFESGRTFRPDIKNFAGSGATGLIQFMPKTAISLGTSVEALAIMTAEDQLEWVRRYFKPYQGRMNTLSDVYMAVLWPKAVGQRDDYVLFQKGSVAFRQNAGLDADANGKITKFEAAAKVYAILEEGRLPKNQWVPA